MADLLSTGALGWNKNTHTIYITDKNIYIYILKIVNEIVKNSTAMVIKSALCSFCPHRREMNGADCVPEYELNSNRCHCKLGFCGTNCEHGGISKPEC